jgi:hypothetical protein
LLNLSQEVAGGDANSISRTLAHSKRGTCAISISSTIFIGNQEFRAKDLGRKFFLKLSLKDFFHDRPISSRKLIKR